MMIQEKMDQAGPGILCLYRFQEFETDFYFCRPRTPAEDGFERCLHEGFPLLILQPFREVPPLGAPTIPVSAVALALLLVGAGSLWKARSGVSK